jgi:hypothetical protein
MTLSHNLPISNTLVITLYTPDDHTHNRGDEISTGRDDSDNAENILDHLLSLANLLKQSSTLKKNPNFLKFVKCL